MAPIDVLLAWFDSLPSELQRETAAGVFESLPSSLISALTNHDAAKFSEQARRWSQGTPNQHAGTVLMLAGVIDLLLLHRGTEADWAEHQRALEEAERVANLNGWATRGLEQLPRNTASWIIAATQWRKLRETSLSLASLTSWIVDRALESYLGDELDPDDDEI
jgi:hypothetical protein